MTRSSRGSKPSGSFVQSSPDQEASEYLATGSFQIIDDDVPGGTPTFTEGDDSEWIAPVGGSEVFDGLGGQDVVTLDLRTWTSVSTSISGNSWTFTSREGSTRLANIESISVVGTTGNDTIRASLSSAVILAGDGNDSVFAGDSLDILDGGAGDDSFNEATFGDVISGGSGTDRVIFDLSAATVDLSINLLTGEGAGGAWTGIEEADGTLGQGDDSFTAAMHLRTINGGAGTDFLTLDYSGTLADVRTAEQLDFRFLGPTPDGNSERVVFSDGSDELFRLDGFEGFDITATNGDDNILISTATEDSILRGLDGDDWLTGSAGDDLLEGGAGNDNLTGGEGNDVLDGGAGDDTLVGGAGADFFVYLPDGSANTIADFDPSEDTIVLDGPPRLGVRQLLPFVRENGQDVVISAGSNALIISDT